MELGLIRAIRPGPTTGLLASIGDILAWADTVPSARLAQLAGGLSRRTRAGAGTAFAGTGCGQRLWGRTVLRPLGFRLEPDLSEGTIGAAFAVKDGDLLLVEEAGVEIVPAGRAAAAGSGRAASGGDLNSAGSVSDGPPWTTADRR